MISCKLLLQPPDCMNFHETYSAVQTNCDLPLIKPVDGYFIIIVSKQRSIHWNEFTLEVTAVYGIYNTAMCASGSLFKLSALARDCFLVPGASWDYGTVYSCTGFFLPFQADIAAAALTMTATRKEAVHFLHPFQVSMETNHRDIMVWERFPRCRTSVRGTGHQWIPLTEASKSSFKVFSFVYKPVEQTLELLVIRNIRALTLMWRYCNGNRRLQYPVVLGDV